MAASATSQNDRFVAAALAGSEDCIKIIDLDGRLQFMSDGGQQVMEVDDFSAIKGCPWPDFWQGQGNTDAIAAIDSARQGKSARFVGYADTAKGNRRFWDVKVSPIFTEDGIVENILSISRDITSLKDFEDQQALLRNELTHRIKNILALVSAVTGQTLKDDDDMATAKPALLARLAALGRAHDLLMQNSREVTTLSALAETMAKEQPSGRISLDGPKVLLSPKSGLAIALAFHELATNAIKYGALATSDGHVSITWTIQHQDGADHLKLLWKEQNGPIVQEPTRKGFGSRMIERALASYVQGHATASYHPDGLIFQLSAPVEALKQD